MDLDPERDLSYRDGDVLKVILRDRYLTYMAAIGIGGGLFYFYSQGHNGGLYNPLLFRLWNYPDLVGDNLSRIAQHRVYVLLIALVLLALAHLFYQRRPGRRYIATGK